MKLKFMNEISYKNIRIDKMDKVLRRTICLQNHDVNIYNPDEFLEHVKKSFLPKGEFNQIYIIEEIQVDTNCKTGRSYNLLFLEDVVSLLPVNIENVKITHETFNTLSLDNILTAWSRSAHPNDNWGSLATIGLVFSSKDKNYYKKIDPPVKRVPSIEWIKSKKELYKIKPHEPDNIHIKNLDISIVLESKSNKILENFEVFNNIDSSLKIPYVWCDKYIKINKNSYIPVTWRRHLEKFGCIIKVRDIPVIKPQIEITFPSNNLLLRVYPDVWVNRSIEEMKHFLRINNVDSSYIHPFSKEVDIWKDYMDSFTMATININGSTINITVKLNPDRSVTTQLGTDIGNIIFKDNYDILKIHPGSLSVSFRYPYIAINSNILFDVINSNNILCSLLLPQEDKKLGIIMEEKNKFKGNFRIFAKIHDKTLKATITQHSGNKRSNGKPFLSVSLTSSPNIQAVDDFARLFGIALTLYTEELKTFTKMYKNVIHKWKQPPKIVNYDGKSCKTNKDCKKSSCNQITKTCSKNISTTSWWAENYSRKCQQKHIPWVVEQSSVESLRKLGYHVEEFPKGSKEYLTCPKESIGKGKKVYDNFYLLTNSLSNRKDYPFIPCCGAEDRRIQAGALYNKYYYNLENLDLNNGTRIELIFKKFSDSILRKLLKFSKDKLSIIGFDNTKNKFLSSKKLNIPDDVIKSIKDYPEDPMGAILISEKEKSIVATIFVEVDIVEAEKNEYINKSSGFNPMLMGLSFLIDDLQSVEYQVKFFQDRLKRNEDLNTQKRATIGRLGHLPVNIERLLNLVSLENDQKSIWKRKGVTRDSPSSFLHVLKCFTENKEISKDSSFAIRSEFLNLISQLDSGIALCKQSMYDFTNNEILDKLKPNSNEYINPRHFHALAEKIFNVNIILIQRGRDDDIGTFVLPYYKNTYLTQGMLYERTVMIYEHFGTDAEKFMRTPHCELVEGETNDLIDSYIYRTWLYSSKFFSGNNLIIPKKIPPVFFENGWVQRINNSGKGFLLIKDGFVLNTESLPPVSIKEENIHVENTDNVEDFAKDLGAIRQHIHDSSQFTKISWKIQNFEFDTIVWKKDKVISLRNIYNKNKRNSKLLTGYFLFAFSKFLLDSNITIQTINDVLKSKNINLKKSETHSNQSYILSRLYTKLINKFVDSRVSLEKKKQLTKKLSIYLPPSSEIYDKHKLYINHNVFAKSKKDVDILLSRLKLHVRIFMQHDINKLLSYVDKNSIPDFFSSISDFRNVINESVELRSSLYNNSSIINVYNKPLLNTSVDYMWRNSNFTNNKIVLSRTFTSNQLQNLDSWIEGLNQDLDGNDFIQISEEDIENNIPTTLSQKTPLLLIMNDNNLFIPIIEYI